METPKLLTVAETAVLLNLHTKTVERLVRTGSIPGQKVGGQWRIPLAHIYGPGADTSQDGPQ